MREGGGRVVVVVLCSVWTFACGKIGLDLGKEAAKIKHSLHVCSRNGGVEYVHPRVIARSNFKTIHISRTFGW